jgi:hypothetical protein
MPIPSADKTKGKRHIMRVVEPVVLGLGFTKLSRGEFTLTTNDGSEWRLLFSVPTFAPFYRIYPTITHPGSKPILGPHTDFYEAPNTPNGVHYNFRFHLAAETYDRCADNLVRWIHDVAIPWFRSSPTTSWRHPNLSK